MKKKLITMILAIVTLSLLLSGCASNGGNTGTTNTPSDETSTGGRVVVYTYYGDVYTDDVDAASTKITQIVGDFAAATSVNSCYVKRSEKQNDYAYYTIKISGENFAAFVARIGEAGDIQYERTVTQDITDYAGIGKVDDFSTINIHVYLNSRNKMSASDKLWNAVGVVWSTIVTNLFAIILLVLPFAAIITVITVGVYKIVKWQKKREQKAAEKKKSE